MSIKIVCYNAFDMTSRHAVNLLRKIKTKHVRIGVIGLGYVGLPLAVLFAKRGYPVTGFLRDKKKIAILERGRNYLDDDSIQKDLDSVCKSKKLSFKLIKKSDLEIQDVLIICVPTPVDEQKKPDITALNAVASLISTLNLDGKLIVNESTVAPGMTRQILDHFTGEYFLVCSPERVDPGNKTKVVATIPKVIGGRDRESQSLGVALYESVLSERVVAVKTLETAETVKMLENTYRAVNIALVNEFALLCEKNGVDILEVINAAKTKWSFQPHYPGLGVGGHCIPVDPYYLLSYAASIGTTMPVVSESLKRNELMVKHMMGKLMSVYHKGDRVLIYGLTYKKDVKDVRESPALALCKLLKENGIPFDVYDPLLTSAEHFMLGFTKTKLRRVDILVVGTDHALLQKDYTRFVDADTIVIDGRNYFNRKIGRGVIGIGRSFV